MRSEDTDQTVQMPVLPKNVQVLCIWPYMRKPKLAKEKPKNPYSNANHNKSQLYNTAFSGIIVTDIVFELIFLDFQGFLLNLNLKHY